MIYTKEITIKIIYRGWESRIMQRGSFPVNIRKFREDYDQEAARVTYEWITQIRKEGHISEIIQVVYNGDKDITELVKTIENAPLND